MSNLQEYSASVDDKFGAAIRQLATIIDESDPNVESKLAKMMSSDSLLYSQQDIMKYAITCHAKHLSLHLMPIYCYADLHAKHKKQIKTGKFQKGCVNFTDWDNLPIEKIGELIADCVALPYPTQYQLDRKK